MQVLQLERPLVVFDLETTGIDPRRDRIVEIATLKLMPDGRRDTRRRLIHPGMPIPRAASAVHGIHDADVADAPPFARVARGLLEWLGDADLAGYNVARFDIPLLECELARCDLDLGLERRKVVDAMTIYKRKERRDLTAAVRFFLERDHTGAHTAEADVTATADVLEAQLARYDDLPRTVAELDAWVRGVPAGAIDRKGKFVSRDGVTLVAFGKYRERPLTDVADEDVEYLEWLLDSDFPDDAKAIVMAALGRPAGEPPADQST